MGILAIEHNTMHAHKIMRQQILADGGLASPTRKRHTSPKLYYTRDAAGFSNVRLMFESMVAIAAATGRELVIPGPSHIDHLDGTAFHEFQVYSEEALRKAINISELPAGGDVYYNRPPEEAKDAALLTKKLSDTDVLADLPPARDWCFLAKDARIQHFECLRLKPEDQAKASAAVFNGLQFKQSWLQEAQNALKKLGLQPGQYVAAHLRHGDFEKCSPQVLQAGSTVSSTLDKYASGKPLLIITDAKLNDSSVFVDIPGTSHASKVLFTAKDYHVQNKSAMHGLIVDTLLGAMAAQFIGTPGSTFSNGINLLRRKNSVCKHQAASQSFVQSQTDGTSYMSSELYSNVYWFTDEVKYVYKYDGDGGKIGELCWNKQTTFEHVEFLATQCATASNVMLQLS
jgi:hypothetical protein